MRLELFLLLLLTAALPSLAQKTGLSGTVVNGYTGQPVEGASVMLNNQSIFVTTGPDGVFTVTGAKAGNDVMIVSAFGFNEVTMSVEITQGTIKNLGDIKLTQSDLNDTYYEEQQDMLYDEAVLDDEEGGAQSIIALTGASDDIYYNAAN